MNEQEDERARAVEVERQDNEYLRSMAEMCIRICKNTSGDEAIERIVILFGSIERNAVKAREARIVERLTAKREWDTALAENAYELGALATNVASFRIAVQVWDLAIAIAREEG